MDRKTREIFRQAMREIGRKGGKIGGKRSLETMTPEERTARSEEGLRGGGEEAHSRATPKEAGGAREGAAEAAGASEGTWDQLVG